MFYLVSAIVSSSMIMILFKIFLRFKVDYFQAIIINYIFAFSVGLVNSPKAYSISQVLSSNWVFAAVPLGILFFSTLLLYASATKAVGVALTTVCSRTALIVPVSCSFIFFGEHPTPQKIAAIVMILASLPLIFIDKKNEKKKDFLSILPLIGLFACTATIDSSIKMSQHFLIGSKEEYSLFVCTIFLSSLAFGLTVLALTSKLAKMKISWRNIAAGLTLGIFNFYASYSVLNALSHLDATIVYPIMYPSIVVLTTLVGVYIFDERLTRKKVAGIAVALAAIVMLTA
ncbi:MAG: DMT family transporter [Rikenellaceae bacterium]